MRWLGGITNSTDMNLGKLQEIVRDKKAMGRCSPWSHEELDKTLLPNNNKNANRPHIIYFIIPCFKFLN